MQRSSPRSRRAGEDREFAGVFFSLFCFSWPPFCFTKAFPERGETPTVIARSPTWAAGLGLRSAGNGLGSRDIITSFDPTVTVQRVHSHACPGPDLQPQPQYSHSTFHIAASSITLPMLDLIESSHTLGVKMLALPFYR